MTALRDASAPEPAYLTVTDLTMHFGGIRALTEVSFGVAQGVITGLIGPNGAGKTTCFNCITRLYQPTAGAISLAGENMLAFKPYDVARRRIARTFQNVALFNHMTVLDNVLVGLHARLDRRASAPLSEAEAHVRALETLDYLGLAGIAGTSVTGLPYGTRKRIELARALAGAPELLLLDEPAAGLNHTEVDELSATIARINRDFGTTILMVEHHMGLVMGISHHVVVLDSGRKIADGTPQDVQRNPAVIEAYLGAV